MDSHIRAEAQRLAAALICCVIDQDELGANVLLSERSPEVVGQACVDLARWIARSVDDEDKDEFRAGIAGRLQRDAGAEDESI